MRQRIPLVVLVVVAAGALLPARVVLGQDYFLRGYSAVSAPGVSPVPTLRSSSLTLVTPPDPRSIQKHDLIQIIINETSTQKYSQSLETEKTYDADLTIDQLPSIRHLLEAQLRNGDTTPLLDIGAGADREFEGDGEYSRSDRFTTRISATVLEVKPNGTLLLEGKITRQSDTEGMTLVITGLCRQDDVTESNTILSNQMANLVINVQHEGDVRSAAQKGLISKALDTVFAF